MKHLLNDMTEAEKNAIREQHAGGMKVMTEKFSKLLNTKSGDVKPLVKESQADSMAQQAIAAAKSGQKDEGMMKAIRDCIKSNSYSHLMVLTTGVGSTALGALAALFSSGVGIPAGLILTAAGAIITTIEGLMTTSGSGAGSVTDELKGLYNCLKQKGVIK